MDVDRSDREYISMAVKSIKPEMMRNLKMGVTPDPEKYFNSSLIKIKYWWRERYQNNFKLKTSSILEPELKELYMRITSDLRKAINNTIIDCQKLMKVQTINETTAKAIISNCLEENGITDYKFEAQSFRLKVYIPLKSGRSLNIPIKYKEINEKVDSIIPTIRKAFEMIEIFGKDLTIN